MRSIVGYRLVLIALAAAYLAFMVTSHYVLLGPVWGRCLALDVGLVMMAQLLRPSTLRYNGSMDYRPLRRRWYAPTVLIFVILLGGAIAAANVGNTPSAGRVEWKSIQGSYYYLGPDNPNVQVMLGFDGKLYYQAPDHPGVYVESAVPPNAVPVSRATYVRAVGTIRRSSVQIGLYVLLLAMIGTVVDFRRRRSHRVSEPPAVA